MAETAPAPAPVAGGISQTSTSSSIGSSINNNGGGGGMNELLSMGVQLINPRQVHM